jgi:hypothetical protein
VTGPPSGRQSAAALCRTVTALLLGVTLLSCAGPTVTAQAYRDQVAQTAKAMTGIIVTAQDATRLGLDGRMLPTVTDTVVSQAEQDAGLVETTIESRQPPDEESDRLRRQIDEPVRRATGLLTDLRIAVRSGDDGAQRAAADALSVPLAGFQSLSEVAG